MARRRSSGLIASTRKLFRSLFKAVPGKRTMKAAVKGVEKVARNPIKMAGKIGASAIKTAKKTGCAATRRVRKLIKY